MAIGVIIEKKDYVEIYDENGKYISIIQLENGDKLFSFTEHRVCIKNENLIKFYDESGNYKVSFTI